MEDFQKSIKVIIVGNGRVGKTSMMMRYTKGVMTDKYKKTIGTDFCEKDIATKSGEEVKLMLWDTAGQEMFAQLTASYYRGARAVVYAFSTTDEESFQAIPDWKRKVEEECPGISGVLVQNKVDLIEEAKMTNEQVDALAQKLGLKLYRMSVKNNLLVDQVFEDLAEMAMAKGLQAEDEDREEEAKQKLQKQTATTTSVVSSSEGPSSPKVEPDPKSPKDNEKSKEKAKLTTSTSIKLHEDGSPKGKSQKQCCK